MQSDEFFPAKFSMIKTILEFELKIFSPQKWLFCMNNTNITSIETGKPTNTVTISIPDVYLTFSLSCLTRRMLTSASRRAAQISFSMPANTWITLLKWATVLVDISACYSTSYLQQSTEWLTTDICTNLFCCSGMPFFSFKKNKHILCTGRCNKKECYELLWKILPTSIMVMDKNEK